MVRSANTLVVPGMLLNAVSICSPTFWISPRSEPSTLMPSGVRTPVVSMSIRALIGMVQAFEIPGIVSASFRPPGE